MGPVDRDFALPATGTSRRAFLREAIAAGAAVVGGPALLAACGGVSQTSTQAGGAPKRGGALLLGVSGGGAKDTLDPHTWSAQIDGARVCQLYEFLAVRDHNYELKPMLGTDFIPTAGGRQMLVKLRQGVTFHNGKPLTADDVVYTFHRVLDPKVGAAEYGQFKPVIDRVETVDKSTVRFTFKLPFTQLMDFAGSSSLGIIPVGWDPNHPVGTGAFKFESFNPGQQSVFTRYSDYWDSPGPYVDSVTISDISDDSARVNALTSGAVHAIDNVPYALLPTLQGNSNVSVLIAETGNWYPLTMRVDRPPFKDPSVRQAFRWLIDRPQMVQEAYGNRARVGNDLFAIDDVLYAHDIEQREQDIDKAKFLLKQAGYGDGLTVNLVTAPIENGVVESCVVFAQQAKAAGVNVQITKLDNTTFYNSQYLQRVFSVDWWDAESFLSGTAYTQTPTANYPETHYDNPQFNKWYLEAIGTSDLSLQKELAHNMQQQLWTNGGEIIPGFPDNIDGYSRKVTGFVPSKTGFNLGYWGCRNVWFV
jgi:peptide/nickel transport system substrate-binding protein